MSNEEFINQVLAVLPYDTLEVEKKSFCTLSYGQGGYVWFVRQGLLMSVRNIGKERYKGIGIYDVNSILGIGGLHSPKRDMPCFALAHSKLCYVPVVDILDLLKDKPDLCYFMMCYISQHLLETFSNLELSALGTLEEQIISFEKKLSNIDLPSDANISEIALAMAVGAHPGSVCRVRKRLKAKQGVNNRQGSK
jgi:CRP-like cAMP-binding protein